MTDFSDRAIAKLKEMAAAHNAQRVDKRPLRRKTALTLGTASAGIFARITACSRTSGVAECQLFDNYIYADGSSNVADGEIVDAINGVEAWHRVGDDVVLLPLKNATPRYMIVDKLKGFAWENPANYIHTDYTLDIDTGICTGLS